jgi:hypothetical protein
MSPVPGWAGNGKNITANMSGTQIDFMLNIYHGRDNRSITDSGRF